MICSDRNITPESGSGVMSIDSARKCMIPCKQILVVTEMANTIADNSDGV